MILSSKLRKTLDIATRLTIAVLAVGYIVIKLRGLSTGSIPAFFQQLTASPSVMPLAALLLALMLVNWGIEASKWKLLVSGSESISFTSAYLAVMAGLTTSVFAPNRVGEFVGRIFFLKKTDPVRGALLNVAGSYSQLLTTVLFGTAAYAFFAPRYMNGFFPGGFWLVPGSVSALVISAVLFTYLYFNISFLSSLSGLLPPGVSARISGSLHVFSEFSVRRLHQLLLLSISRYLVFCTQFFLALKLCGLHVSVAQAAMSIPVIYLVLAAIPTVALGEIGIRGSISVFVIGLILTGGNLSEGHSLAVISASMLIWIVNIALPSLAGILVVLRLKFFTQ